MVLLSYTNPIELLFSQISEQALKVTEAIKTGRLAGQAAKYIAPPKPVYLGQIDDPRYNKEVDEDEEK